MINLWDGDGDLSWNDKFMSFLVANMILYAVQEKITKELTHSVEGTLKLRLELKLMWS